MNKTKYQTTAYIKELLYKYIAKNKADSRGLFLLPLQTGSGKTYATIEYIKESIERGDNTPIIYTVNTKNNLRETYNKLINILDDEDKSKVILLKSNFESIVDIFLKNIKDIESFQILKDFKEFQTLKSSIEVLKKTPKLQKEQFIQTIIESNNKALKDEILRCYRLNNIQDKKQFLYEVDFLYPTVSLYKYKAIFMTTNKLYYPMFSLDGNYRLFTDKHFKESLLFFDEFDAQKSVLLNMIIQDKVKSSYEFLDLFKNIVSTFKTKQFHKKYKIEEDVYYAVKKLCEDVYEKYSVEYGFKNEFEKDIQNESILIDSTFTIVIHAKNNTKMIDTKKNKLSHINLIKDKGDLLFNDLLRDINKALRSFIGMAKKALREEVKFVIKKQLEDLTPIHDRKNQHEIIQRVVNDIIKEFGYTKEDRHYKYLKDVMVNGLYDKSKGFKSSRAELYEDGFKIINISQLDRDSKTNNFEFFELNDTPENFMKNLCQHLFVVGISATATIDSLMRNFDLSYLSSKVNYITPTAKELLEMDTLYLQAKKQIGREINIKYIKINDNTTELINKYYDGEMALYDELEQLYIKGKEYQRKRLMRLVDVYKEFLLHDEIESFISFSSAFLKPDEMVYSPYNLAKWIFIMLERNYNQFNSKIQNWIDGLKQLKLDECTTIIDKLVKENRLFYIYNSDSENEQKYKEMFELELQRKSKVFIISSYQTIGIGANLEYKQDGFLKDYDALYVDKPTSFTQRDLTDNKYGTRKEKQIKAIFELESLFNRGYFSSKEYRRYAKEILKSNTSKMEYLKLTDSHNSIVSTIIQAIGRLYRTEDDNSKMFLYLDSDISYSVKNFDVTNQTLLPAVKQLIEYTHTLEIDDSNDVDKRDVIESKNRFIIKNSNIQSKIRYMLSTFKNGNINKSIVKEWEDTRKFLLTNPTVNTDDIVLDNCYSKMPSKYAEHRYYYYTQLEDYKDVEIFFEESYKKIKVSRESAMLDVIENTQELQKCVKENSICLDFKYDYLMTPIVFNNLYKGALGEVIGKYLIERRCNLKLLPFDVNNGDEYERFDYKLEDNSVYFDFKYYSQQTIEIQIQKDLRDKAKIKLSAMRADKAIIINIFAEIPIGKSRKPTIQNNIMIVPFLIDITNRENPIVDIQMIQIIKEFIND